MQFSISLLAKTIEALPSTIKKPFRASTGSGRTLKEAKARIGFFTSDLVNNQLSYLPLIVVLNPNQVHSGGKVGYRSGRPL